MKFLLIAVKVFASVENTLKASTILKKANKKSRDYKRFLFLSKPLMMNM